MYPLVDISNAGKINSSAGVDRGGEENEEEECLVIVFFCLLL